MSNPIANGDFFRGKSVLVTGGSRGFGRVLAETFAAAGAKVAIAARGAEQLEQTARELAGGGNEVLAVPADLTDDVQVTALVERVVDKFGGLDCLVNNAGRSMRAAVMETPPEAFRELLELNLTALVRTTRAAVPHLLKREGHVVNIGSLGSKAAAKWLGAYPASKFAVAAYSQQLRLELGPQGLHVLLVCPGPIGRNDASSITEEELAAVPESARRPGGGVKTRLLEPTELAQDILTACRRRRRELVRPRRARLLFALLQLSPALGDWLIERMTSQEKGEGGRPSAG